MTAGDSDIDAMSSPMGAVAGEAAGKQHEDHGVKIAYEDLRQWIAEAEKLGEIRVVKGATWQEGVGMAA